MKIHLRLFLLFLFIYGCSSPRYVLNKDKVGFNELLKSIQQDYDKLNNFAGTSRISIESPEFSGNFFADIFYNANDSLLIEVSGPFGISVGKMFVGKKRFIFLNNFANQFYSGKISDLNNQNFLQFPIKINELSNFFIANDIINNMKIINYTIDGDVFYIQGQNSNRDYNIWVDNITGRIKKIEYVYENKIVLTKEYNKFVRLNDVYFPKHIKLVKPEEKQAVSIYYNSMEINGKISPSKFAIKISDSSKQIKLDLLEMNKRD